MSSLLSLSRFIDALNEKIGTAISWALLAAVLICSGNALVRYAINTSSNAWLEIQWYLFGAIFLLASSYTLKRNEHVRIDVIVGRFSKRTQVWFDVFGFLIFLLPATALIPSKPDGSPKYRFAFCLVATDNLSAVLAVSNLYALPDYPLDGRMDGMESDARLGLVQSAGAYDLDGLGLHPATAHTDSDGYRDVLTRMARTFEPAFSLDSFDVREG